MSSKKITKQDVKAGLIHRCENCESKCSDNFEVNTFQYVMGQKQIICTKYYCDKACRNKNIRDTARPKYEAEIKLCEKSALFLKKQLYCILMNGDTDPVVFQAIKMFRQYIKAFTLLLSGESTIEIVRLELYKLSKVAMDLAELIAEEQEDLTRIQLAGYNTGMYSRNMAENKYGCLSAWFE
jgi:hypothetical protein